MTVFLAPVLSLALTLLGIGQDRSTGPSDQPPIHGGKMLEEWLKRLDNKDRRVCLEALIAIGKFGDAANEAVPVLLKRIQDDDWEIKARTTTALGLVGRGDQGEFKPLLTALKDKDPRVRMAAAQALTRFSQSVDQSVAALAAALKDSHEEVRATAAQALGAWVPFSKAALPDLIQTLGDPRARRPHRGGQDPRPDRPPSQDGCTGIGQAA